MPRDYHGKITNAQLEEVKKAYRVLYKLSDTLCMHGIDFHIAFGPHHMSSPDNHPMHVLATVYTILGDFTRKYGNPQNIEPLNAMIESIAQMMGGKPLTIKDYISQYYREQEIADESKADVKRLIDSAFPPRGDTPPTDEPRTPVLV